MSKQDGYTSTRASNLRAAIAGFDQIIADTLKKKAEFEVELRQLDPQASVAPDTFAALRDDIAEGFAPELADAMRLLDTFDALQAQVDACLLQNDEFERRNVELLAQLAAAEIDLVEARAQYIWLGNVTFNIIRGTGVKIPDELRRYMDDWQRIHNKPSTASEAESSKS